MSVCKNCGKENQALYKFCLRCGSELVADAEPLAPRQAPVAPRPASPSQPAVNHAATSLVAAPAAAPALVAAPTPQVVTAAPKSVDSEELLAPSLRPLANLSRPASARACPDCGNVAPIEFSFCGQCGARLVPKESASITQPLLVQELASGRMVLLRPDGSEGGAFALREGENLIGRSSGELFSTDGYLSPRHAELILNAAGLVVRDLASLNGVFLKLTAEEELSDGDIFRIGQELLRFEVIRPPQPLDDGTEILGSPNPGCWGRLVVVAHHYDGSAFLLTNEGVILGRERGDILFPEDGYVSGTHARLAARDGRFYLHDLDSSNGTFVRIRGERTVPSGALLLLGQQLFRVEY